MAAETPRKSAETLAKVVEFLNEEHGLSKVAVRAGTVMQVGRTRLKEDLGFDSLNTIEFVMDLEDLFMVSISDESIERCQTISDVVELVDGLVEAQVA